MQTIRRLTASTLLAAALLVSGCALFQAKTDPVPVQVEVQQLKEFDQVVSIAEAVVDALAAVQRGEDQLYDLRKADGARYITPKQHGDTADVFTAFAAEAKQEMLVVTDLAATPQTRSSAASRLLDAGKAALGRLGNLSPGLMGYVDTALALIKVYVIPRL